MTGLIRRMLRKSLRVGVLVALLTGTSAAEYAPAAGGAAETAPGCTQASPWTLTSAMNVPRVGGVAVTSNGYVFVLGGWLMTPFWHEIASVESAPIEADGALGAWVGTTALTSVNQALGAVATDDYVYVIGGWNGSGGLSRVQRAAVLADGQLGAWEPLTPLPDAYGRINLATVITGTFIYALGGFNYSGNDVSHSVLRTTLESDGLVLEWSETSAMLNGRRSFGAVAAGDYLYALGGSEMNNAGAGQSVERARINADGSLGAWEALPDLLQPRLAPVALVDGGYLYAVGGAASDYQLTTSSVERALINADGTLGPWQYVDALLNARVGHMGVSANGRFYMIAGHAGHNGGDYAPVTTSEQVAAYDLAPLPDNSVTINEGALFTNQTAVTLTLSGEVGTALMQVSNDGGFAGAAWQTCVATLPWTITQYGQSTIPRVVYLRYKSATGVVSGTYADDIILDVTAPSGTVTLHTLPAVAPPASGGALRADSAAFTVYLPLVERYGCAANCPANVQLTLAATDDASGVSAMQIGTSAALAGAAWEPFATSRAWYLPPGATTVYVRYRDYAGNISAAVSAAWAP